MSTETRPLAATTDDRAVAIRRYRQGQRPDVIADDLEADLETITAALRRATDLPPWDDHRALAHLFHDYGYDTLDELAELFDGQRSSEVLRDRIDMFGIERPLTATERLERMERDEVGEIDGLSPLSNDEFSTPDDGDGQQRLDAFGGGSA